MLLKLLLCLTTLFIAFPSVNSYSNEILKAGDPAPEIIAIKKENQVKLSSLKGKWVYVNFWATWCGTSLREVLLLKSIYTKYRNRGFEIIGVAVADNKDYVQRFILRNGVEWPTCVDEDDQQKKAWEVKAIPSAFLIDSNGRISKLHVPVRRLENILAKVLRKAA